MQRSLAAPLENNKENLKGAKRMQNQEKLVDLEEEEYQLDEFTQARQDALREIDPEVYDPHPDEAERLKCQHAYLSLLTQLKSNRKNIIKEPNNTSLTNILKESDELYKNVKRPADSVLDSRLLVASADLGHLRLKNIPLLVESSLSTDDLSEGLKTKFPMPDMDCELVDFTLLGQRLAQSHAWQGVFVLKRQLKSLHQPRYKQQQAAFEASQPTRLRRKRVHNDDPEAELEVAKELHESKGEKETFDFVRDIFVNLQKMGGSCNFYKFILDPTSFARSVENMFYVAFLVKEDRVKISGELEEDFEIAVLQDEDEASLPAEKRQIIMDLTMEKWTRLCQKLNIQSPLIKP